MKRRSILAACLFGALAALPHYALSQNFPSRPVKIVIPYPPGGVDVTIRYMQNAMQDDLRQPVVLENRPGANGMIGAEYAAHSPPDGYTTLAMSVGLVTGALVTKAPVDPIKDFTPITMPIMSMGILVAKPALPLDSIRGVLDYAKRNPGKLTYGHSGIGSEQHLAGELIKREAGVDITHVPYKGFGPLVPAILGGEVDMAFFTVEIAKPLFTSGKVKPLTVFLLNKRHPLLPNVPDLNEVLPSFHTTHSWIGFFGPAGMAKPIVMRLNAAAVKALNLPEVRSKLEENGAMVVANSPEEFAAMMKADFEIAAKVVKDLKARGVQFE